jgi:hypothetical protein
MPRAGGNGHEGQPQESFRDHSGDFQAVNFFDLMCSTTRLTALRVVFSSSEPKTLVLITPAM